tara:strand:- start:1847 stop:2806 length:960 start_codon:yes stop_codon:yes gene_type:complete
MKNIIIFVITLLPFLSIGQSIQIELDTNSILLGEQTKLRLGIIYRVDTGEEINVQFPIITDTLLSDIEVIKQGKVDTFLVDKNDPLVFQQSLELTITSFTVGRYLLPSFAFILNNDTIQSGQIPFDVRDVAVTENTELAEIKKPIEDPLTVWDWVKTNWLYLVIPLGLLLVIGALVYFFITKKGKEKVEPPKPIVPEHIIALEKLQTIQSANLWQDGQFKEYHSEISVVIREYLEKRFQINALENTTDEIFTALRFKTIDQVNKEKLHQLLELSDLVKFAKEIPIGSENEETMKNAVSFVEETKFVEEITPIKNDIQNV